MFCPGARKTYDALCVSLMKFGLQNEVLDCVMKFRSVLTGVKLRSVLTGIL